jgi:Arylsulfotransferase (ASST)
MSHRDPRDTTVDQQRVRRTRTGLIASDPERAFPGFTLFTPMFGDGTAYLVDLRGEVQHTWRLPYPPGLHGYLLDNGHLFYGGKIHDGRPRFDAWERFKSGAVLEADWNGKILWEVRHPDHHHDARKLANGNVILLCLGPLPDALRSRIKGGLPGTEADGTIYADYLVEMTTDGDVLWEWRSWEHPETEIITAQDRREEWTHGNTVAELPGGNLVVGFRNISTVVIIERSSGKIVWKLGSPPLAQQHDPRPLPSGNLTIFDNGTHRRDHPAPYSRVIEVDPRTGAIVWEYRDQSLFDFFSPYISGAQRLPNGNTLICEGCDGRIFEVTPDGLVVWEYVNPHFAMAEGRPGLNNWVFRAFRYSPDEIARARAR